MFKIKHKETGQVNEYVDQAGVDGFRAAVADPENWQSLAGADPEAQPEAPAVAAAELAG